MILLEKYSDDKQAQFSLRESGLFLLFGLKYFPNSLKISPNILN